MSIKIFVTGLYLQQKTFITIYFILKKKYTYTYRMLIFIGY